MQPWWSCFVRCAFASKTLPMQCEVLLAYPNTGSKLLLVLPHWETWKYFFLPSLNKNRMFCAVHNSNWPFTMPSKHLGLVLISSWFASLMFCFCGILDVCFCENECSVFLNLPLALLFFCRSRTYDMIQYYQNDIPYWETIEEIHCWSETCNPMPSLQIVINRRCSIAPRYLPSFVYVCVHVGTCFLDIATISLIHSFLLTRLYIFLVLPGFLELGCNHSKNCTMIMNVCERGKACGVW